MTNTKNITIYARTVLERRPKGFFSERLEIEIIKNYTQKKQLDFEKSINEKKKVKFEKVAEFTLTTKKGKADFIKFLLDFNFRGNQNGKASDLEKVKNDLLDFNFKI